MLLLTDTWNDPLNQCVYVIERYNLYFSTTKRNQINGIFVFVKNNYESDFFEYDFDETNIVKLINNNLVI